jgi:hypothetical protein
MRSHCVGMNGTRHYGVDDLVRHERQAFFTGRGGNGCQPAMVRAQRRVFSLLARPANKPTQLDNGPTTRRLARRQCGSRRRLPRTQRTCAAGWGTRPARGKSRQSQADVVGPGLLWLTHSLVGNYRPRLADVEALPETEGSLVQSAKSCFTGSVTTRAECGVSETRSADQVAMRALST